MTAVWKELGFWDKIGKWLKWGFRYKYPSFLGPAPLRRAKWDEKVIAEQAQRRASFTGNASELPLAGAPAPIYSAPAAPAVGGSGPPQLPQMAHTAPAGANIDFADPRSRSLTGRPSSGGNVAVSPVSPMIAPADNSSSEIGPALTSAKGKEPEVLAPPGAAHVGEAK